MDAEGLNPLRRFRSIYAATVVGTAVWLAATLAAPFMRSRGFGAADFLYVCFSPTCHQIPSRSFFLWGFPAAVCARCLGIYAGFAIGVLLYPFRRGLPPRPIPTLKTFILFTLPIVADTAGNFLGLWNTGNMLRFLTGSLWGTILPLYWFAGLAGLFPGHGRDRRLTENVARSDSKIPVPGADEIPQK